MIICVYCAEVVEEAEDCSECNSKLIVREDPLYEIAPDAVKYGYQYRGAYAFEEHSDTDDGPRFSLVELAEPFTWIALAAIAG